MALDGAALLSRTIEIANDARRRLNDIPNVYCFGEELEGRPGVFDLDPTKVTITVKRLGYTGYEAEEILRRRYNVQCELADLFNALALFTIGTTPDAADELVYGVRELAREDRPVDIFSPSGVLEARLKTRHLQAAHDTADPASCRAKRSWRAPNWCRSRRAPAGSAPR